MRTKVSLAALLLLSTTTALLTGCHVTYGAGPKAAQVTADKSRTVNEKCIDSEKTSAQLQEDLRLANERARIAEEKAELEKQKRELAEERLKQLNKTEKNETNEESSEHDGQDGS